MHIKDLRLFTQPNSFNDTNWSFDEMLLIDNSSQCFGYHINNGYPMLPFTNNYDDLEMVHLYFYLKAIFQKSMSSVENYSKDIDEMEPENNPNFSIQEELKETFCFQKLQQPKVTEQILSIVEYHVQEISDDDPLLLEKDPPPKTSNPTLTVTSPSAETSIPSVQITCQIPDDSDPPLLTPNSISSFEEEQGQSKEEIIFPPNNPGSNSIPSDSQHSYDQEIEVDVSLEEFKHEISKKSQREIPQKYAPKPSKTGQQRRIVQESRKKRQGEPSEEPQWTTSSKHKQKKESTGILSNSKLRSQVEEKLNEYRRIYLNTDGEEKFFSEKKEGQDKDKKHNFYSSSKHKNLILSHRNSAENLKIGELSKDEDDIILPTLKDRLHDDSIEVLSPNISKGTPLQSSYLSSRYSNVSRKKIHN